MEINKTKSNSPSAVQSQKYDMKCHIEDSQIDNFWTANKRQCLVIALINMVTFLFGASQGTASISVSRLIRSYESSGANDTTWPKDFEVTDDEEEWISK